MVAVIRPGDALAAAHPPEGEVLDVLERVVVAPSLGLFRSTPPETYKTEGVIVYQDQVIGFVSSSGKERPVLSPFTGFLTGMLAVDGERVREGQPIAWLRLP
jgi:biotin carboxyl carrier protein